MTTLSALKELAEKVEAGTATRLCIEGLALVAFDLSDADTQTAINAGGAYKGFLDAAKALHEALLPTVDEWEVYSNNSAYISIDLDGDFEEPIMTTSTSTARAWLLAILRAKIAEMEAGS
jgi:hypothetical protein